MDSLQQDLRYSLRGLARQPGFVTTAVLSLALGIGVNTAIFSALNGLLLRPMPLRELDRAVIIYHSSPGRADAGTSFRAFQEYRDRTETFQDVMAYGATRPLVLVDGDRRDQVYAELVTSSYFSIADISLQAGAPFTRAADRVADPDHTVVLSDRFWRLRFDANSGIVGKTVSLNSKPFTVTGVAAPGFLGLDAEAAADLWMPMTAWALLMGEPGRLTDQEHWITTVAVLRPGITIEQARTAAAIAGRTIERPVEYDTRVRSARERIVGPSAMEVLAIGGSAFAIGLLVLVLACTNVANLLMARAAARQHEMSVRMALGSSRSRLLRLWLTDSLVLSLAAGTLGLVFASWLLDLAVAFKPPALVGDPEAPPLPLAFDLDVRVFAFALGVSVLTALAVGLLTGLQGSRPGVMLAARAGRTADRRFAPGFNIRSAVIALQMALSLILLIPCGLFVRSWVNASTISPGLVPDGVLLLPISTNQAGMRITKPEGFDLDLVRRVAALPGVEAASVMDPVPLWFASRNFHVASADQTENSLRSGHASITPGYFDTLRIPLLAGRDFTNADNVSAPAVAIVNETVARHFWPGVNAVGRRLRHGKDMMEVVGVAKDSKYVSLADASEPFVYLPLAQDPSNNMSLSLAVRTIGDPRALSAAIEREVRSLMPGWPTFHFRTLSEGLEIQQLMPRLGATLLGALGLFGLLLAAVGVYGVMAYVVRQRTHEIGIRLALGAPTASVQRLVMKQGMAVCLVGAAIGLGVAVAGTQLLGSLLYGISTVDPITYLVVPSVLIGVALLACYAPARRITKVSALQALRYD